MKNTKWRDIIVSHLIGIAFGVLLITIGFQIITDNIENSIITAIISFFVWGILIIIVYRNRKIIISKLTGIERSEIDEIGKQVEKLKKSVRKRNLEEINASANNIFKIGLLKYSEVTFRVWAFRIFFSLLAIFGGTITAGLFLKQNELIKEERDLLSEQNKLIKTQNDNYLSENKPRLIIKNSGVTFRKNNNRYNFQSIVKFENFGKREAIKVGTNTKIFEVNNDKCTILFKEKLDMINPVFPSQVIDYVQTFSTENSNSKKYLVIEVTYQDELAQKKESFKYHFRFPEVEQINRSQSKELGLFNMEKRELDSLKICD